MQLTQYLCLIVFFAISISSSTAALLSKNVAIVNELFQVKFTPVSKGMNPLSFKLAEKAYKSQKIMI